MDVNQSIACELTLATDFADTFPDDANRRAEWRAQFIFGLADLLAVPPNRFDVTSIQPEAHEGQDSDRGTPRRSRRTLQEAAAPVVAPHRRLNGRRSLVSTTAADGVVVGFLVFETYDETTPRASALLLGLISRLTERTAGEPPLRIGSLGDLKAVAIIPPASDDWKAHLAYAIPLGFTPLACFVAIFCTYLELLRRRRKRARVETYEVPESPRGGGGAARGPSSLHSGSADGGNDSDEDSVKAAGRTPEGSRAFGPVYSAEAKEARDAQIVQRWQESEGVAAKACRRAESGAGVMEVSAGVGVSSPRKLSASKSLPALGTRHGGCRQGSCSDIDNLRSCVAHRSAKPLSPLRERSAGAGGAEFVPPWARAAAAQA